MTGEIACADTNIFVRALTQDDARQTRAAFHLLQRLQTDQLTLVINDVILTELMWVLRVKRYNLSREAIAERMEALLNTDGIVVKPADLSANVSGALKLYTDFNIDYTDAYIASWMKNSGLEIIYTFNTRHFRRVPGLIVKEPEID
jgi:predicted nucleic acid-binding protein